MFKLAITIANVRTKQFVLEEKEKEEVLIY